MILPLILDTDIGMDVDDAIALCYAALDPRIKLLAVTTVNGDTQKRAAVAGALLRLCGRDIIPVGAGASLPLDGTANSLMPLDHVDTDDVQGNESRVYPAAYDVLATALEAASAVAHRPAPVVPTASRTPASSDNSPDRSVGCAA